MRIELSNYFKTKYSRAYLFDTNDGRRAVELVPKKKGEKKRFISYAKYLWISANNREVPRGYQVDHIDNNPRNDVVENLQLLTQKENIQKYHLFHRPHPDIELTCPICGKLFYKDYRFRNRVQQGRTTCSRKCMGVLFSLRMEGRFDGVTPQKKKSVIATHIKTGEVKNYSSISSVTEDGFIPSCVWRCCTQKVKKHKGFTWKFA